jgi:transcriptional regulator
MSKNESWDDVRAEWAREDPGFEEGVARAHEHVQTAYGLRTLRLRHPATQEDVAEWLDFSEADVARIEEEADGHLREMMRFLATLGARMEVRLFFDDGAEVILAPEPAEKSRKDPA